MTISYLDPKGFRARRDEWFQEARNHIDEVVNCDGTGKIPAFSPPRREIPWVGAALYTGSPEHVALINRAIGQWHEAPRLTHTPGARETHGSDFGIFQSNTFTHLYHRFHDLLTPEAEAVMRVHVEHAVKTFRGSGQCDTKFHGSNDNMPMMATQGLIFAGEILGHERALKQGLWNLHQFRLLLSRGAWASEYNSSTYTAVTLSHAAQIASYARDPEIRQLALEIEHRLWAETVLHYHRPTFRQAGPQSRAYSVDLAGHTHSLQILLWAVFGPQETGRDPVRTFFQPDGKEIIHFGGCPMQSVAEFVHFLDTEVHVPVGIAELFSKQSYPARLRGRTEIRNSHDGLPSILHTTTYQEKSFSLGSVNLPFCGGEQTASLFATYQLKPEPEDFRDAATVFFKFLADRTGYGIKEKSKDGRYEGEQFISNRGWSYAAQKDNVGVLLVSPNLTASPLETDALRLEVLFPAHYGKIKRSIIGNSAVRDGFGGEDVRVVPVSVEAGEVYINILPLIPTALPRQAAVRLVRKNDLYETLELINYEGPRRTFTRDELEMCLNGVVFTIDAAKNHASLEEFHRRNSDALITDYCYARARFFEFRRHDAWFQVVQSPQNGGVMTEAIDGRAIPRPVYESNQIDVATLPFMTGPVSRAFPMFPWQDSMEVCWYPESPWMIGSRGVSEEAPYANPVIKLKLG
jgi:hypothetical protein